MTRIIESEFNVAALNIASYIKELIIKNECIILPGLGGFETHYQNAVYDKQSGKILPPSKQVVFREDFTKDNGTLLNYISFKEKIGISEIKDILDKYISGLKEELEKHNRVELKDIGTLIKQIDGKIFFKPIAAENYLIDSYGLSELKLPAQEPLTKPVKPNVIQHPVKSKRLMRVLSPVLIFLFITTLVIFLVKSGSLDKVSVFIRDKFQKSSAEDEKVVFGRMKYPATDSIDTNIQKQLDDKTTLQQALQYSEDKASNTVTTHVVYENTIQPDIIYLIISGSFKKESYALRHLDNLKKQGLNPFISKAKNGYFRVILNSYTDKTLAKKDLKKFREMLGQKIWLLAEC